MDAANNETINALKKVLDQSPDNVHLIVHLASLLENNGSYDEAWKNYEKAILIDENNTEAILGTGRILLIRKNFNDALKQFESVLWKDKNNSQAHYWIGKALEEKGDVKGAVSKYRRAYELNPKNEYLEAIKRIEPRVPLMTDSSYPKRPSDDVEIWPIEKPTVNFEDVGGLEELKERIRQAVIYPLQHPEIFEKYGKSIGGGILLYGPPGCGKTYIAKATAGEANVSFINVKITDILDMWYGESEKRLNKIFDTARRHKPTIVFFDEIDAIGHSRLSSNQGPGKTVVNQFLSELDGIDTLNDKILIVGATNAPWDVDPALRRPGRFDDVIFVPPPDAKARIEIFKVHIKNKPVSRDVNLRTLSEKIDGYSGADIAGICSKATDNAIKRALKTKKTEEITMSDFEDAVRMSRPTVMEWLTTAKNYVQYANESGIYDDVEKYLIKGKEKKDKGIFDYFR